MADDYTVVVTDRMSGKVTRGGFSTLEQAERVANVWRQSASYFHVKIEVTRPSDVPEQEADMDDTYSVVITNYENADSRRRIDWIKVGLVIAGVLAAITIVVAYFVANPVAWDALVKLASHPFIVDNAAGLAVTAAGIAAARHLHNRSR